jgi:hypothetical protein
MGLKLLTLKFIGLYLYNAALAPIPSIFENTLSNDKPPEELFYFLFFALWLPETAILLSKAFRTWIREGLEDGEGILHKADIKDLIPFYASFMIAKTVVLMSWTMIFYTVEIPYYFFVTLVIASFGIGALPMLKNIKRSS